MIRFALIGFLYLTLPLAVFIFDAKLGRAGVYAHLSMLCLIPIWLIATLLDLISTVKTGFSRSRLWLVRLSLCLALFLILFLASRLGEAYREHLFRERLPFYMTVVSYAEKTLNDGDQRWVRLNIPQESESSAMMAIGKKVDGVIAVKFLISGHFPARHFGYLYISDETKISSLPIGRTITTKLAPKGWYEYYD
jgi:hypothetical protein